MAQHDYVISNGTGAAVRSDLNNALLAIVSQNSGATEPTTTYAYQWWADTTTGLLKIRNSANNAWITLRELDGTLTIEDGTVSAPGLAFRDDLNTGIWRPGTDQFAISTNGVERVEWGTSEVVFNDGGTNYDFRVEGDNNANLLFVDASADAVGIGTSAPQAELNVAKTGGAATVYIESDASNNATTSILRFGGASGRSASIQGFRGASSNIHSLDFYTYNSGDSFGMRLTPTGLGIGNNSPGSFSAAGNQLVVGSGSGNNGVTIYAGSTSVSSIFFADGISSPATNIGAIQYSHSNDSLVLSTGDQTRATIDSSGRLLVGTSSTSAVCRAVLQGNSSDSTGAPLLYLQRGLAAASISSGAYLGAIEFADSSGNIYAELAGVADAAGGTNDYPGRLVFSVTSDGASSPTERMRINNSGVIYGFSSDLGLWQTISAAAGTTQAIFRGSHSGGSIGVGTTSYYVWSNGNVQNTNGSFTAISDQKLKENIVDANSQWSDLKSIKIRNWNYKAETGYETHRQIGPIAQELETVCPGLVFETPDRDEDGNETGEVTKGVNQSVLYMKAVKALQEAMERIEQLEAKVAALESA